MLKSSRQEAERRDLRSEIRDVKKMLCHEFEDRLTDYLDGTLEVHANREFAEHAMRCPVCHDLLTEVKNTLLACSASEAPVPDAALEARILLKTMPETAISCADFEAHLTDYLMDFWWLHSITVGSGMRLCVRVAASFQATW